jgi:hypothetical protein
VVNLNLRMAEVLSGGLEKAGLLNYRYKQGLNGLP